jgi:hypothetical protein
MRQLVSSGTANHGERQIHATIWNGVYRGRSGCCSVNQHPGQRNGASIILACRANRNPLTTSTQE